MFHKRMGLSLGFVSCASFARCLRLVVTLPIIRMLPDTILRCVDVEILAACAHSVEALLRFTVSHYIR